MTQELTKAAPKPPLNSGGKVAAIVPQSAEQVFRLATAIAESGMAPKDMATPQKLTVAIFHGLEVGLLPMQAVQSIAIIHNRPTIWGDAAIGLVQGSGLCEWIDETLEGDGDNLTATCSAKRAGSDKIITRTFSVADAKRAGLWGKSGPWSGYPQRMLKMRARSWCLRDGFADVLKGLHIREEVRDYLPGAVIDMGGGDRPTAADVTAMLKAPQEEPAPTTPQSDANGAPAGAQNHDGLIWIDHHGEAHTASATAAAVGQLYTHLSSLLPRDAERVWKDNAAFIARLDEGQLATVTEAYTKATGKAPGGAETGGNGAEAGK